MHNLDMSRKAYGSGLTKEKDVCDVGTEQPLQTNMGERGGISSFGLNISALFTECRKT